MMLPTSIAITLTSSCLCIRVLIAAVNKATTNLELNFFNNCFDDDYTDCKYGYSCMYATNPEFKLPFSKQLNIALSLTNISVNIKL